MLKRRATLTGEGKSARAEEEDEEDEEEDQHQQRQQKVVLTGGAGRVKQRDEEAHPGDLREEVIYRGVTAYRGGWKVRVHQHGVRRSLPGPFSSAKAAAQAFDVKNRKMHGLQTTKCNFLLDGSLNPARLGKFRR